MRRLSAWAWKEWHEQRRTFLVLVLFVPVAVWAQFLLLPEAVNWKLTWLATAPAVMALYALCVATDVFAGERQRGTIRVVQRLPHGLRSAFLMKALFLLLGAIMLMGWTFLVLRVTWWWDGTVHNVETHRIESVDQTLMLFPGVLALFACIAMVSLWLPRGGAAAGAAPLILAPLLLPLVWMDQHWPTFRSVKHLAEPLGYVVCVLGLGATFVSWRFGLRFGGSSWRALLYGLPVVLILTLGAYGYEAVALRSYLTLERDDPRLVIEKAYLGRGSKFVYMEVGRSTKSGDRWGRDDGDGCWTPRQFHALDLATGDWKPLHGFGGRVSPIYRDESGQRFWMAFRGFRVDELMVRGSAGDEARLIDATTAEFLDLDPEAIGSDAQWGFQTRPPGTERSPRVQYRRLRDGWVVSRRDEHSNRSRETIVDESLAEVFVLPSRTGTHRHRTEYLALGVGCVLTREGELVLGRNDRSEKARSGWKNRVKWSEWTVHDTRAGVAAPAGNVPAADRTGSLPAVELDAGIALICDPSVGSLERWDPITGERNPLTWEGQEPTGLSHFYARDSNSEDEVVVVVDRGSWRRQCVVVVDRRTGRARRLTDWNHSALSGYRYLGQDDQGAFWLIEGKKQLVKIGPALGQREVVFP